MEQVNSDAIAEMLIQNPDLIRPMRNAIELHETYINSKDWLGFECSEIGMAPWLMRKLVEQGIAYQTYKSRRYSNYKLTSVEAVKEALKRLEDYAPPTEGPLKIPDDMFSIITGYDDIKSFILKSLRSEKPIHTLLVGPTASAKTLFLQELSRIEGSRYALGHSSSRAGLTRFLMEWRPKILLIDEIDKASRSDMSILLSLMETGIVTELKAFRTDTIQLKTWVFGAANDISKMPKELLSRFVVFQLPNYSRQEFIDVVVKVLTEKEKVTAKIARYIAEALSERTRDVRHAVKIARVCKKEREVDEAIKLLERYKGI